MLGKALLLIVPILLLEYARKRHPKSAEQGTWIAFLAYLTLYLVQALRLRGSL